jgi:hypothetical protein
MISGWSYSFQFGMFGSVFQFSLLPIMKGHNLLWDVFGLLQSLSVTHMAHFSTFLQNLIHSFFILLINKHIVNDIKKAVIYGFFFFLICQTITTIINLWFILVELNSSNQYFSK